MKDVITDEARNWLEKWPMRARRLFAELLEDAGSDLQRELLQRALAASHTPAEIHAFADELRAMSDEEAFDACTLDQAAPTDYTVAQLLRAEADPLFAFELKGGELSPAEEEEPIAPPARPKIRDLDAPPPAPDALAMGLANKKAAPPATGGTGSRPAVSGTGSRSAVPASSGSGSRPAVPAPSGSGSRPAHPTTGSRAAFQAESSPRRAPRLDWNDLGGEPPSARPVSGNHSALAPGLRFLEELANEATRALGVSWVEHDVDTEAGLKLEDVIHTAASALTRGLPVPIAIGPKPGDHRKFVLCLQTVVSGKNRAWQLYDPFTQELVWANEGDLLARAELPFANKVNRRITRVVLPTSQRSSF